MQREVLISKCEKCNFDTSKLKSLRFARLPDVLCIHLKRFEYYDGFRKKIKNPVAFPKEKLDLGPFFNKSPSLRDTSTYDLIGVIDHFGEVNFGHYIAECKNGKRWFTYDDSKVSDSEINFGDNEVVSTSAYILFYQKVKR